MTSARICASVLEPTVDAVVSRMAAVAPSCALVEVRLDALAEPPSDEAIRRIVAARPRPLLVTYRPVRELGGWTGPEAPRLDALARASALGAEWIDVELDAARALPPLAPGTRVLVSHHERAPVSAERAATLLRALEATPRADALKLALPVDGAEEALALCALCAGAARPTIGVAMGGPGLVSRVAGWRWGAPWVYASADPERPAAPGSLAAAALTRVLAGRSPWTGTALFGVTGRPVNHSRSPYVHNHAFAALGLDAVMSWLETARPDLLLEALERDPGARGLAVTIPHKEAFARLVGALSDDARGAGAVNTVVRAAGGGWAGHNTDVVAADALLRRELSALGRAPSSARIGVLGAGGSARAVAFAAERLGAETLLFARTAARARDLALALGGRVRVGGSHADVPPAGALGALDVIVNATPLGMGGDAALPVSPDALGPGTSVYDLVYTPPETPLIVAARARGARVVTGVEHFVAQARAQVALWLDALAVPRAALDALPLAWFEERTRETL